MQVEKQVTKAITRASDGKLFGRELLRSEAKAFVGCSVAEMEESLQYCQEPQAKVPLHCQPLQAWRGGCYAPHQSGLLSNSLHLPFICK